jgi:prevent-host-death family protein
VIESTATNLAEHLADFLVKVQKGETIRIHDNGRPVARLIPDTGFTSGAAAAALFRSHAPDPEAASAIALELQKLDLESEHALDLRH